ncbi:MAG TPA: monovalent cation/H+ antiporter complex subunit F [Propionicimonas sp.]|jgi:multicomponent Na+:H+ antiporter subunit F|nr:monovalent cation/H+ antiporter complex subunit F [Propionicimonas sp.]
MTVVIGISLGLLVVAACLVLWRMVAGPTPLDRIISSDVMVAIVIAGVGLYSVLARNDTGLPILLGLCLVGFTGAVGVARLLSSPTTVRRLFDRRQAMQDSDDS